MRYVIDVKGICIDDWENTTLHAQCNGEMWEIPFDKTDVVEEIEEEEVSDDYIVLCFSCKRITSHEERDLGAEWGIPLVCTCCGSQNHVLTYGDEGEIKTMEEIDAEARDYENNRRGGE